MTEHNQSSISSAITTSGTYSEAERFQPAMMPLQLSVLALSGAGAAQLLQGQLTCDVNALTEGEIRYGCHCNVKGRVISYFMIYRYQDVFYLLLPMDLLAIQQSILKKYAVFFKVDFQVMDSLWKGFAIVGEALPHPARALLPELPEPGNMLDNSITLLSLSGPCPMYMVWGKTHTMETLWQALQSHLPIHHFAHWQLLELLAGRPYLSVASSEIYTPHELNLQASGAISFNKGCYTGQEIVARMHYRGQAKQRLYAFTLSVPYSDQWLKAQVYQQDKAVGTIVSAAPAGESHTYVLAVVKNRAIDSGPVHCAIDQDTQYVLQPETLPYALA